ncbi:MAG: alpha/beta family hydrolase [Pseudomonadota bacterium]
MPEDAQALLVFAHGAGAGHTHKNMDGIACAWAEVGLASLRYNFPFIEAGRRRVDSKPVTLDTIEAAYSYADAEFDLPVFLAGHSFGGRMNSHAVVERNLDPAGLIFCAFPLHQPKKPSVARAEHLTGIVHPMLFLSGTRDDLAEAELLQNVVEGLTDGRLEWLDTANHSYAVLKRSRTNPLPVFDEIADHTIKFVRSIV